MQEYLSQFAAQFAASIPNIVTAVLIFIISLYFARLLSNLLKRVLVRRKTDSGVTQLLVQTLQWTIIVFGAISALQRFFNVTAFLTGLGIIGFTIGFALQNVMQNFVSGIILLMQQPFKVGDEIKVLDFDGVVLQINLRTTEMRALDGRIIILPNADVISHAIVNYTRANRRRVDLPLVIARDANTEKVRTLLFEVLKDAPGYVAEPAPEISFKNFNDASVELTASFWVDTAVIKPEHSGDAALILVKDAFAKKRIESPLPTQTVYVRSEE